MSILIYYLHNVGKLVEKRGQKGTSEAEVLPPGGIIASDDKLNGGIVMCILPYSGIYGSVQIIVHFA